VTAGCRAFRRAPLLLLLLLAACGGERLEMPGGRSAVLDRATTPGPAPIIVVLHGAALSGGMTRDMLDLSKLAGEAGFAVVFPNSSGPFWNDEALRARRPGLLSARDDIGFLDALLDRLVAEGVADPARIHLAGISNGAMMALRYACERRDRIASLVLFKATLPQAPPCAPSRPLPVLLAAGTDDPIVGWDGAVGFAPLIEVERRHSVPETFAFWRAANGCTGLAAPLDLPRRGAPDAPFVILHRATGCAPGATTLLYEMRGVGHRLPGQGEWLLMRLFGPTTMDVEASALMLAFARNPGVAPHPAAAAPLAWSR
jgi:polyhydroxybutyrate depolymerase